MHYMFMPALWAFSGDVACHHGMHIFFTFDIMFTFHFENRSFLLLHLFPTAPFPTAAEGRVAPGVVSSSSMFFFNGKINLKG